MLRWMIANDYGDAKTLERRARAMEEWIKNPVLLEADKNANYKEIIEIDLNQIKEPLLACPNDPDDIKPLSEVQDTKIDEGFYKIFDSAGARTEVPGCSLCMGNQARVEPNSTVISTSTRNFPNRLGDGADVFLASAELSAVSAILGRLPSNEEYLEIMKDIDTLHKDIYKYLNFNEIKAYVDQAKSANIPNINIAEV